jgi:hypothetical protein
MKWTYMLAGGLIGFIVGATVQFIEDFDKDLYYNDWNNYDEF